MSINAYYNGEFKNRNEIRIPLTDRAIFFGDGIYDAAIGRNGKVFMLDEHIERFFSNIRFLGLPFLLSQCELRKLILKTVGLSGEKSYFVYFQLTRFSEERAHAYPKSNRSNLLITVSPFRLAEKDKRLKLVLQPDVRHKLCYVKTVNLLPAVMASHYAEQCGADETVFYKDNTVTECSHSNIHIVKDSVLMTHPLDGSILPGIAREHLLSVCKKHGIEYRECKFSVEDMLSADEVIVTSSSKLAIPAEKIENVCFEKKSNSIADLISEKMREDFINATN